MQHRDEYDGRQPTDCPCDTCGKKRALFLLGECKTDGDGRARLIQELIADRDRLEKRLQGLRARVASYV